MAFIKDMVRMWLHAWKRFISIALISLLGVAVLTGIYAGCRDAFLATDRFFDTQGLHDIQVLSTAGLTDDDIAALRKISGVAKVQGERSQTVTVDLNGKKTVTMQEIGTNGIDQPYLQSGRMPEKSGEIAVTRKFIKDSGYKKGDHITVTPQDSASSASSATSSVSDSAESDSQTGENGSQMSDSGESDTQDGKSAARVTDSGESDNQAPSFPTELTIVGVVLDPQDLTNPDGYSGTNAFRSSATSDYTFFAPSDGVTGSMYTAVTILVKGAADKDSFSDVYDDTVSEVADRIDGTVRKNRQQARHQELLDAGTKQIDEAKAQADKQFAAAQQQIDSNRSQLNQQIDQIVNMQAGTAAGSLDETTRETLRETVIAASPQLVEAKAQLDQAQSQLDQQKKDTERTLQSKQNELEDSIPQVRWYVQDRSQIGGFSSLKSDLESIQSLGNAFPIVFLLVAVMMSLTAMARMVEEDRGLIGTYTGLGYGRLAVASRYLLFALFACLIGGGLGLIAGFLGIPAFLLVVLRGLYVMPDVRLEYDWLYGTAGVALFVIGVLAATVYACVQEMRQKPASLMRPKAPRAGSRILLERIKPLWNRMSFLGKVTARNIFRFKSRLIMTVGGVAGCTALIVCGLAINDTVAALGAKQYQDVYQYDLMVVANDDDADAMRQKVASDGRVTSSMDVRVESGDLTGDSGSESIQLVAVPDSERSEFGKMVTLQPVRSSWVDGAADTVSLGDDGVIVSQSAASAMGVKADGMVTLTNGDDTQAEAHVSAVIRSVIGSDVYVSETYYRQLFDAAASGTSSASSASDSGESDNQNGKSGTSNGASSNDQQLVWNAMYAKLKGSGESQAAYAEKLEDDDAVMKAVSCAHMAESFKFDLMGAVVALIVALAGGLALVVLFTLANTNVSEREREMATLKVLGFFDKEVHHYVNREMMVLTMMGVVLGLPLGRFVGGLLTAALNMPALYFEVECTPLSYVIAAVATMAFALLVQLFVNPVLDRIDPISSLKSVE
ncbi:ABC transporter permease [Bifidobacterium pseudocatenulatum]|uniref:ABC transporter permease n=1 Tax=Bifidobacterium pseudocatenulatum TaxID=28026 RepID=UPI001897C65F|nr:ABC transporter permease [Bifidobacterium pseudocatenulatum]MDB6517951.1 ABC transporter permease [Bifidobacterium pseudocatenulatum]MDB6521441.1 ABC transporter permease [Bifidobacterium pseudocatenulatum]MDB6522905.1 ABC transporter permease [Bifidobacterium pseudocatenulatum]MDB6524977.1 ABC transporter permease [Bifidobacterium pseudocatenulatum]MDB6526821.1 ABC transporter permease [Bifidobacterium pseudocatenulatum]